MDISPFGRFSDPLPSNPNAWTRGFKNCSVNRTNDNLILWSLHLGVVRMDVQILLSSLEALQNRLASAAIHLASAEFISSAHFAGLAVFTIEDKTITYLIFIPDELYLLAAFSHWLAHFLTGELPPSAKVQKNVRNPFWASFPGKGRKKGTYVLCINFFGGILGDQKGGPKRAIFGHKKFIVFLALKSEECRKPQPPLLLKKVSQYTSHLYCNTPPICTSALLVPLCSEEREYCQYSSHLYRSTPPICIAIRLPFVSQYFWENLGGCGHRNVPQLF